MTDNEIIRSLEKQIEKAIGYINCQDSTIAELTAKNNCQKEQIESLIAGQETLQKALAEKNAYIEDLKIENEHLAVFLVETKSEAVKEFAERLKDRPRKHLLLRPDSYYKQYVRVTDIDNLVKEMVGEG